MGKDVIIKMQSIEEIVNKILPLTEQEFMDISGIREIRNITYEGISYWKTKTHGNIGIFDDYTVECPIEELLMILKKEYVKDIIFDELSHEVDKLFNKARGIITVTEFWEQGSDKPIIYVEDNK